MIDLSAAALLKLCTEADIARAAREGRFPVYAKAGQAPRVPVTDALLAWEPPMNARILAAHLNATAFSRKGFFFGTFASAMRHGAARVEGQQDAPGEDEPPVYPHARRGAAPLSFRVVQAPPALASLLLATDRGEYAAAPHLTPYGVERTLAEAVLCHNEALRSAGGTQRGGGDGQTCAWAFQIRVVHGLLRHSSWWQAAPLATPRQVLGVDGHAVGQGVVTVLTHGAFAAAGALHLLDTPIPKREEHAAEAANAMLAPFKPVSQLNLFSL